MRRSAEDGADWRLVNTTDPGGLIGSDVGPSFQSSIRELISVAESRSGEIILGAPINQESTRTVFLPTAIHLDTNSETVVLGLIDLSSLLQGLYELNVPSGLAVAIRGRFPSSNGPPVAKTLIPDPSSRSVFSIETRTVSASAELSIAWFFSDEFLDGPSQELADIALFGGGVGTILLAGFLGLLMTQNDRVSRIVDERTEALRENRSVLRTILENVPQGVIAFNDAGKVTVWNTRYQKIFGLADDLMVVGQDARVLVRDFAARGGYGEGDVDEITDQRLSLLKSGKFYRSDVKFASDEVVRILSPTVDCMGRLESLFRQLSGHKGQSATVPSGQQQTPLHGLPASHQQREPRSILITRTQSCYQCRRDQGPCLCLRIHHVARMLRGVARHRTNMSRTCKDLQQGAITRNCMELHGIARNCAACRATCKELQGIAKYCKELQGLARTCGVGRDL